MKTLASLLLISNLLSAVTLSPLYQTVNSKETSRISYELKNPTKEPVAVNFSILRVLENNGTQEKRAETHKVSVHPSQFVLKANESKKVRVKYMDTSFPEIEELYRVIAKELDIDVSDTTEQTEKGKIKADIKMRYTYEGLLFVKKENAQADLSIKSFEQLSDNSLKIIVENQGNASAVPNLKSYDYIMQINNNPYTLTYKNLLDTKINRVLSKQINTIVFKTTDLPIGAIQSIKLQPKIK